MKKVIIPRKDHEVYFLGEPENANNKKQIRQYVNEQMEKLHPAFSSLTQIDTKRILLNGKAWLMVTVMDEELLTEYRVLHNRSLFFTNTSIMAGKNDFTKNGVQAIDDEKIGFDTDKNEPVSVPLEMDSGKQNQEKENEKISKRYSVFRKKMPQWCLPAISAGLFVLLIVSAIIFSGNSEKNIDTAAALPRQPRPAPEIALKTVPSPIEILASVAVDVVNVGGRILDWHSSAVSDPFMTIILQGINIVNVRRIFNSYNFALLEDIQEIRYGDNEPYITVFISMDKDVYTAVPVIPFPMQGFTFSMIGELSNLLDNIDIAIIFETLPSAGNNYNDYTISFQAVDWNLIRSLEIISLFCTRYALHIRKFDIQITGSSLFTASCTLSHCDTGYVSEVVLGNEKYYIPAAFGFLEERIFKEPVIAEAAEDESLNIPVIGSIRDSGVVTTFYRDTADGKIRVRVENER